MPQMLMLNGDIVVSQQSHVLDLSLFLLRNCRPESVLVLLQVIQASLDGFYGLFMQRKVREDHALVYVGACDGFVGVFEVFIKQTLLNLQCYLKCLQCVLMLSIFFVDATEVIEAKRPELQQLFLRTQIVPHSLVEEHIDTLGCQVQFLVEVQRVSGHDFDIDLVDEGGQFLQESESLRQGLFVLQGGGDEIDQSFVDQDLSELLRLVLQVLMVLLQQQQGLLVLVLLPKHQR